MNSQRSEQEPRSTVSGLLRVGLAVVLLSLQVAVILIFVYFLQEYAAYAYFALQIAGGICIVRLINREASMSSKLMWSLVVLTFPVSGLILYLLWGGNIQGKRQLLRRSPPVEEPPEEKKRSGLALKRLGREYPTWEKTADYLNRRGFLIYENTSVSYFSTGESMLESLIRDLENAQRYILLEYFIVAEGRIWNRIQRTLLERAARGVEVKLLFDDFGSILRFSDETVAGLRAGGIQVAAFNPVLKYVSRLYLNYRDHEKVAVIDGNIGYTGGVNLADEYANLKVRFGHWKDTAVRLKGAGVWGLAKVFIQMWQMAGGIFPQGVERYRPDLDRTAEGFCQPFSDGPLNNPDNPAESVYLQMITNARRYVYITTPYFAVEESMMEALCMAAESGVDVRILLPAVPDHWYTGLVANSYYGRLLRHGVGVYEYTPGFLHGKMLVCDGEAAVVGSINMDYRSFRLHYECGALLIGVRAVDLIVRDIRKTMEECGRPDLEKWLRRPWYIKVVQQVLRIFSVFM